MFDSAKTEGLFTVKKYDVSGYSDDNAALEDIKNNNLLPYEVIQKKNTWLNTGWAEILKLITGESAYHFNSSNAKLGVGDVNTAAAATQTDLLATTNKTYKGMDANYPTTPSSQRISFQATFTTSEANYDWNELVLKNAGSGVCWNRVVNAWGTKGATEIWAITLTIGKA